MVRPALSPRAQPDEGHPQALRAPNEMSVEPICERRRGGSWLLRFPPGGRRAKEPRAKRARSDLTESIVEGERQSNRPTPPQSGRQSCFVRCSFKDRRTKDLQEWYPGRGRFGTLDLPGLEPIPNILSVHRGRARGRIEAACAVRPEDGTAKGPRQRSADEAILRSRSSRASDKAAARRPPQSGRQFSFC